MSQYTPIERSDIVELYIENQKSIILTQRTFRAKFPRKKAPDPKTIRSLYAKFKSSGVLSNVSRGTIQRRARSNINITIAQDLLKEDPNLSTERGAQALGISKRPMRRILRIDLQQQRRKGRPFERREEEEEESQKSTYEEMSQKSGADESNESHVEDGAIDPLL